MTIAEEFIRYLLGPIRSNIKPLALAVDLTIELLYVDQDAAGDIHVTRDVYPVVARMLGKTEQSVAKAVERLAAYCWNALDDELMMQIIGKHLHDRPAPREILFYLAYYIHHKNPFYASGLNELFASSIAF